MLGQVALVSWILTVALGLTMFVSWVRSPAPLSRTVLVHLVTALLGLAGWTAYLVADRPELLGWAMLAWVFVLNTAGDQLMLARWRSRADRGTARGARAYLGAAREVLSFRRPVVTAHALLGAVTFFSVLMVTLGLAD